MMKPSVDILIVSHNTRKLLVECIRSIHQFSPPTEQFDVTIRVLDNASSDGTIESVGAEFPYVKLISSPVNVGFGKANNILASTSSGDYLLFLNPDTRWIEDIISPMVNILRSYPEAVLVGPRLIYPDGGVQYSSQRFPTIGFELALELRGTKVGFIPGLWDAESIVRRTLQENAVLRSEPRYTDFLWGTCWLMRQEDANQPHLFDERFPMYDEDLDACYRLRRAGRRILYFPSVTLVHVGGASSAPAQKLAMMRSSRARFYRIHRGRTASVVYRIAPAALRSLRRTSRRLRRRWKHSA